MVVTKSWRDLDKKCLEISFVLTSWWKENTKKVLSTYVSHTYLGTSHMRYNFSMIQVSPALHYSSRKVNSERSKEWEQPRKILLEITSTFTTFNTSLFFRPKIIFLQKQNLHLFPSQTPPRHIYAVP